MRDKVQIVIIGAGIVGAATAWHLAREGWRDILVLDKGPIFENEGSTSHAPGGMHLTNSSKMMTEFAMYTRELISGLAHVEEGPHFFRPVGGVEVAYTPVRLADLRRRHGWATSYGLESHLISPAEVKEKIPVVDERVILGGYWVPQDTNIGGWQTASAIGHAAKEIASAQGGVCDFVGDTKVHDVEVVNGHVRALLTSQGRIECEVAVLCTNIWSPVLGDKVGLKIPLLAAQHQYTVSSPLEELAGETREVVHPLMRHQDFSLYFRQHRDCYGVGNYRHVPLMVDPYELDGLGRTAMLPFTPEHHTVAWRAAQELIPGLKGTTLTRAFNGMFAFSVDGYPIIGEAPLARGFWVATASWITHSGGVGRAVAGLITHGDAGSDIREADINRFLPHQTTRSYVSVRSAQNYREVYDIIHPWQPIEAPRGLRLAPWHKRMEELGARFFPSAGWEAPQWYEANGALLAEYGSRIPQREGWASHFWSPIQGAEHLAVRERVGLFSIAGLAVIEVQGAGATRWLNYLCANQVDRPVGSVVYTAMLTHRGGIMCDVTLVRRSEDVWWVITGGALLGHDIAWLRKHLPDDGSVLLTDISGRYTPLGLWGPSARELLQTVVEQDLSNQAFPFYTAQPVSVGAIPAYALRISYAGELGWELYAGAEYGPGLWDALWDAGRAHGLIAAGGGAFDSLRLEKGYRLWGADIHTDYSPLEAGLGWAVRLEKEEFIGRDALLRQREEGVQKSLCCMTLEQPGAVAMGKEPIFHEGRPVGYVTSANFGYSVERFIVYGYLPVEFSKPGTEVEVEYFGERIPAVVRREPLFDPRSERMKA
jgi:glycine cleavage system T protein